MKFSGRSQYAAGVAGALLVVVVGTWLARRLASRQPQQETLVEIDVDATTVPQTSSRDV